VLPLGKEKGPPKWMAQVSKTFAVASSTIETHMRLYPIPSARNVCVHDATPSTDQRTSPL
jgi:hypothetical protein